MKRAASALGVVLLATGCNAELGGNHATSLDPTAISRTYPTLPKAVAQRIGASNKDKTLGSTRTYKAGIYVDSVVELGFGSGVFVEYDDGTAGSIPIELTAAHVDAITGANCLSSYIDSQTTGHRNSPVYEIARQSPADPEPAQGKYDENYNGGHDVAVQLLKQPDSFKGVALPESAWPSEQPDLAPGSIVFAINDEPTSKGVQRIPEDPRAAYHTPAIYGLMIIGKSGNDYYAIDGVSPAYGSARDNETRGGASGGGTYLPDGTPFGLTVGTSSLVPLTSEQILQEFNIRLPAGKSYHVTMIAAVTRDLIQQDYSAAKSSAPCTALPTKVIHK